MPNTIQAVVYTDDLGNNFVTGMDSEVFAQETATPGEKKVGGSDFNGTDTHPPMPRNLRPRKVRMNNPAGNTRYVVALSATAPIWTGGATTLTLEDSDGAATVYTKVGTLGEKFRRRKG